MVRRMFKKKKRETEPLEITVREFIDEGYANLVALGACKVWLDRDEVKDASCTTKGKWWGICVIDAGVLITDVSPRQKLEVQWARQLPDGRRIFGFRSDWSLK
jgi:hypothetical protein